VSAALSYPLQQPSSTATELQALSFLVNSILAHVRTVHPVRVVAVHGGGLGPIGTVDVLPLVSQVNGIGQGQAHTIVYGRPYNRWQGGSSAVILDPEVGDIGQLQCCDRDISNVVATLTAALPASLRRFSFADGIYVSPCLSATAPTQYVQFVPGGAGINVVSPGTVTVNGVTISSGGDLAATELSAGNGATGAFEAESGQTITVANGIVTNIS
jgi:hypothetical protein